MNVSLPAPRTVDRMRFSFVADRKHSVPTTVTLYADGQPARTLPLPKVSIGTQDGTLRTVELGFDPVTAKELKIQIDGVRQLSKTPVPSRRRCSCPCRSPRSGWPSSRSRRIRPRSTRGAAAIS